LENGAEAEEGEGIGGALVVEDFAGGGEDEDRGEVGDREFFLVGAGGRTQPPGSRMGEVSSLVLFDGRTLTISDGENGEGCEVAGGAWEFLEQEGAAGLVRYSCGQ
jgi:hypothetical protein